MRIFLFVVGLLALIAADAHSQSLHGGSILNSVGSASAIGQGGAGGNASSINHGGMGGAGGLGGAGGMGGNAAGGDASATGGIGHGGDGGTGYGGAGGTGQGGAASNAGNNQSTHFDQQRQSPSVFMSAPAPTAPCQASIGGFLSFVGGVGLAGSRTLEECEIREAARISHAIGQPQMAREIVCMGKYAARTSECQKGM